MKSTHIGTVSRGIDREDRFYLLELEEDDPIKPNEVRRRFTEQIYTMPHRRGALSTDSVRLTPYPLSTDKFIAIHGMRRCH